MLSPARPLRPGRYVVRRHARGHVRRPRLRVPARRAAAARGDADRLPAARGAPASLDALLPVAAALVALLFAVLLARSYARRRRAEGAVGNRLPALRVAAACEALAQRAGWSAALFRAYYLCGGVLTVALLGAGSAWLQLPRAAATCCSAGSRREGGSGRDGRCSRRSTRGARGDRGRAATGERRARRARVPVGDRAELLRHACCSSAARSARSCAGGACARTCGSAAARSSSR